MTLKRRHALALLGSTLLLARPAMAQTREFVDSAKRKISLPAQVSRGMAKVTPDPTTGRLKVELAPLWKMTEVPGRIAPGHGACPGCGAFPTLHQIDRVLEGDVVVLFQTGCAMVVTTGYPTTAHRINYIHNLFQNGAATLSGLVEMYHERVRRGELPESKDITFVMVTGDGGMDIGMGAALGAAHRNHRMIILEYDNQGYMNTGAQLSAHSPASAITTRIRRRSSRRATCPTCSRRAKAIPKT